MKLSLIPQRVLSITLIACGLIAANNALAANNASYIDLSSTGSLGYVNPVSGVNNAYSAPGTILFAFADPSTPNVDTIHGYTQSMLMIQTYAPAANYYLSVGGQNASTMTLANAETYANNIVTQIGAYNLAGVSISGVDMDFEHGETSAALLKFAQQLKTRMPNLKISMAPQLVNLTAIPIVTSPSNVVGKLGLSSGGINDNYGVLFNALYDGQALIDTIFAQTYNTPGWTINGADETSVAFYASSAVALGQYLANKTVPPVNGYLIGEPANRGGGSAAGTIYGTSATYDQAAVLSSLQDQIVLAKNVATSLGYKGTMMWSINADYDPADIGNDTSAKQGAFSTTIFGAPAAEVRNLQVQFTNNSDDYSSVIITLVSGADVYYPFGKGGLDGSMPLPLEAYENSIQCSIDVRSPTCPNSFNLNVMPFPAVYTIQVTPTNGVAWLCTDRVNLKSEGSPYNIIVNNYWKSCEIQ